MSNNPNIYGWNMKVTFHGQTLICLCTVSFLLCSGANVDARQGIFNGEISARYDHQDRTYDDGEVVAESSDGGEPTVIVVDNRRGDRQRYMLTPRLNFSSRGLNDFFELTYAPTLNYDHLYETTDLDHDFGLRAERNITRDWLVSMSNSFFLGDDPLRQREEKTAVVIADTTEPVVDEPQPVVGSPAAASGDNLTERYGRRRYWTNELDLQTSYAYGEGSQVDGGYTFSVLRNDDSDSVGGYTDYDRHTGTMSLTHRFNQHWSSGADVKYVRGLFDEPDVFTVTPASGEDVQVAQITGTGSDDLTEYNLGLNAKYDYSRSLHMFAQYSYLSTDYDAALREDYGVNNLALGVDYDVTRRMHCTLSGGPSWGAFESFSSEYDYNAYGGLTWDFLYGSFTLSADKRFNQDNFNGRRSGVTDVWDVGASLNYQATERLSVTMSTSYQDNRRLELPVPQTVVIVSNGDILSDGSVPVENSVRNSEYTEKSYEAGVNLNYSFMRYFGISGGYRYYDHASDLVGDTGGNYNEHRFFIQLSAADDIFHW